MRKTLVLLAVLTVANVAVALDVTSFAGKTFGGFELSERFGAVEVGGVFAAEFDLDVSKIGEIDLDLGDTYEGLSIKLHLAEEDAKVSPFVGYTPLIRHADLDNIYHVWEAGVMVNLTDTIGIGLSYITCDDFVKDDQWMLRFRPIRFK